MSKIIFLDVDGTLCGQDGMVPKSAGIAVKEARENGHKVFLCTGRSKPEIIDDIVAVGFDGIIGAGGAYIEVDEKIVKHQRMDKDYVEDIVKFFKENNIAYYLESNDGLFSSPDLTQSVLKVAKGMTKDDEEYKKAEEEISWFTDLTIEHTGDNLDYDNVNKICFISTGFPYEEVKNRYEDHFTMHHATVAQFGNESGEISIKGIDKKTAISELLDYINGDAKDTMAYGDGNNDIPMFEAVDYSVAMENATDQLKAIADEITEIAEEDGIYNSFKKNGII